jgi:hypothetical protein
LGSNPPYCLSDSSLASSLACMQLSSLYVLDVLKTGRFKVPDHMKKIFTSTDLKDVLTYERLKETVGTF